MKMLTGCCVQCSTEVMKRIFPSLFLAAATLSLAPGCVERRVEYIQAPPPPPGGEVVVNEAPPAPPQEVIVASPGPEYVWTPGYYTWRGGWVWVRGAWVIRPHPHAVWVAGHWGLRGHGYVWIGGHWR